MQLLIGPNADDRLASQTADAQRAGAALACPKHRRSARTNIASAIDF
ncbi:MAG: hypothetical protein ABJC87_17795 [Roseobacter sp.]